MDADSGVINNHYAAVAWPMMPASQWLHSSFAFYSISPMSDIWDEGSAVVLPEAGPAGVEEAVRCPMSSA